MNSDRLRALAIISVIPSLAACAAYESPLKVPNASDFGEANRQTMMAQVVDPDPVYDSPMVSSGNQASQAIDRYQTGTVRQPENLRTTDVGGEPQ